MERVFAKYEKFKSIMEDILNEDDGHVRKLFSHGLLHIFDAENMTSDDSSPSHRLNIGIYERSEFVHELNSLNTVYLDNNLPNDILKYQLQFFTSSNGVFLDVAFGLNKERYDDFKRSVKELKNIEQILNKLHGEHIPLRKHQFNNLKFFSKYLVGDSIGGDYFDIDEINRKIYCVLASFNSYVSSVSFIKKMDEIKNNMSDTFKNISEYIDVKQDEIKSVIILEIEPRLLEMRYMSRGDYFISSQEFNCGDSIIQLQENDLISIGSIGFKSLMSDFPGNIEILKSKGISNCYNEFFSFLNKKKKGRFLQQDASLITLEVNENIIKEVN